MKTINTLTADFKNALYELINKSDLPVVNVLMVINEIQQSIIIKKIPLIDFYVYQGDFFYSQFISLLIFKQ